MTLLNLWPGRLMTAMISNPHFCDLFRPPLWAYDFCDFVISLTGDLWLGFSNLYSLDISILMILAFIIFNIYDILWFDDFQHLWSRWLMTIFYDFPFYSLRLGICSNFYDNILWRFHLSTMTKIVCHLLIFMISVTFITLTRWLNFYDLIVPMTWMAPYDFCDLGALITENCPFSWLMISRPYYSCMTLTV